MQYSKVARGVLSKKAWEVSQTFSELWILNLSVVSWCGIIRQLAFAHIKKHLDPQFQLSLKETNLGGQIKWYRNDEWVSA